jgi:ergothioneine biosynthesis protein EgtB
MSLCAPLGVEDYVVQSMPDASPVKWHLAHTSWFFETFVLKPAGADLEAIPSQYGYLFNSYYNAIGERIARPDRGLLSRPTVAEVCRFRAAIDDAMRALLDRADDARLRRLGPMIALGLHHEQQHQELILTDLKHAFGRNPLRPIYRDIELPGAEAPGPIRWLDYPAGLRRIGHDGPGFAFDNESPRHRVFVVAFRLADRLVTNGEYLAFIEDGGYERPEFWLSDGWNARNTQHWTAPLYWERSADGWRMMTLAGMRDLDEAEPVCHVSYYEADAFARWSGARLPSEAEWEVAAEGRPVEGNFLEGERFHPAPLAASDAAGSPSQLFGDVWEWTRSPYSPYPGYQPAAGALGEYNGKFMCNQMVLRGGSCATPASHIRSTYRNFFPPDARWQFSGIRLARDV